MFHGKQTWTGIHHADAAKPIPLFLQDYSNLSAQSREANGWNDLTFHAGRTVLAALQKPADFLELFQRLIADLHLAAIAAMIDGNIEP